jgi:hypothetical protein
MTADFRIAYAGAKGNGRINQTPDSAREMTGRIPGVDRVAWSDRSRHQPALERNPIAAT